MTKISRRSFVHTGAITAASIPFCVQPFARAETAAKVIRHDVVTPEGQAMLKIYASAVGKMMATTKSNPGNPSSWLFQWYTHAVRDDRTKNHEILQIYPHSADPRRALAKAMWNTCEAHFSGRENFFLPWHRLFVRSLNKLFATFPARRTLRCPIGITQIPTPIIVVCLYSSGAPMIPFGGHCSGQTE